MESIDGKKIAEAIIQNLCAKPRPVKFFGAVLVGNDPGSLHFLEQKKKVAEALGIEFRLYKLLESLTTDELREEIGRLARPATCGGFIVQLPLPENVSKHYVLNAIPKEKDVDLLSEQALGGFYTGRHLVLPPSVGTVEEILKIRNVNLRELKVVLIGAGFLIGKPIGFWLQNRVAELTVFDEHVKDLRLKLHDADIIISGAGHPNLFGAKDIRDGATVIDFGFNTVGGKAIGDFGTEGSATKEGWYTPTPGGTGPILVAKLFDNFFVLNS